MIAWSLSPKGQKAKFKCILIDRGYLTSYLFGFIIENDFVYFKRCIVISPSLLGCSLFITASSLPFLHILMSPAFLTAFLVIPWFLTIVLLLSFSTLHVLYCIFCCFKTIKFK